jgi:Domain of unknown function (DUF1788)
MTDALHERLNKVLPRVTADEFIAGRGLGNEVAFHIFDYPPERELEVRGFIPTLLEHIPIKRPGTRVKSIDLFDFVLDHLQERGLLEKALRLQREKGDDALTKALSGPLDEAKLRAPFAQVADPAHHDLVLLSGVGTGWPLVRVHSLPNNLHPVMGHTPLVVFYPGSYDGLSLRLFGKFRANYYRAFKLIP